MRRRRVAGFVSIGALSLLAVLVVVGIVYHPGWVETVPGATESVATRIDVQGAKAYPPRGTISLVYVRERDDLNYWEYLLARYVHDHAELSKQPPPSPITPDQIAACDMRDSQAVAKTVALQRLGYKIATRPGVEVVAIYRPEAEVAKVLRCGDVIRAIDGDAVPNRERLTKLIGAHHIGDRVEVAWDREGKRRSARVRLIGDDGVPRLGIEATDPVQLPVQLTIDTGRVGGPSAGLAMTLTLLDTLTPGELTGGKRVVATGTIEPDGSVGEIGAVELKAVAVRNADADLFLIPKCGEDPASDPQGLAGCRAANALARSNAKGVKVVEVATLDEALAALRAAGGDPLPASDARS
jgi:PDZ domain-containing protein